MTEEVEGRVGEAGREGGRGRVLTVFCWSYVDVIPSDGQVRLPAERQGPSMCDELLVCVHVCPLSPLLQPGQARERGGWMGGDKG